MANQVFATQVERLEKFLSELLTETDRAKQMAIAKVDRTEIEASLRQELGAEQSRQIVEAVLGSR